MLCSRKRWWINASNLQHNECLLCMTQEEWSIMVKEVERENTSPDGSCIVSLEIRESAVKLEEYQVETIMEAEKQCH